jgi:hypothetical protein
VAAALLPFYSRPARWSDCEGFECTMVTAPLTGRPVGGEIELSVIRQRAESGRRSGRC